MPASTTLATGQYALGAVQGVGAGGSGVYPLGGATATIDNYAAAYVAPAGSSQPAGFFIIVPKVWPAAGQSTTVNVTITGTDANGNAVTSDTATVTFSTAAAATLATAIDVYRLGAVTGTPPAADPGSATVTLI